MKINKIAGYILIIVGFLTYFDWFSIFTSNVFTAAVILFGILGLTGTALSLGARNRVLLFISTSVFLTAVLFFTIENFVIQNQDLLTIPTILFISGAGFVMLFIDNTKAKAFLHSGLLLIVFSMLMIFVLGTGPLIAYVNRLSLYILDFWAGMFIIIGFLLLASRYKSEK